MPVTKPNLAQNKNNPFVIAKVKSKLQIQVLARHNLFLDKYYFVLYLFSIDLPEQAMELNANLTSYINIRQNEMQ